MYPAEDSAEYLVAPSRVRELKHLVEDVVYMTLGRTFTGA